MPLSFSLLTTATLSTTELTNFLRSSFRGENWEIISPDLTTNDPDKLQGVGAVQFCTITTIDESPLEKGLIWVGTDDGNLWLTRDGGKNWQKLNERIPNNPHYWITRVTASHHQPGRAYVSFTGFYWDDFRPFLYKTEDFGQSWVSISGNLPQDESINVIKEDRKNPNLLFVGTDKGVYVSLDGGQSWSRMKNNLPTVPVHDLVIHPRENDLVVGTHGRGFFITDISPLQELTPDVLAKDVYLFQIEPKVQWIMPHQTVVSYQNFAGENEPHGVVINYYLKQPVEDGVIIKIMEGKRVINELKGSNKAGLNRVEWYMTKKRKRTKEEIVRWEKEQELLKNMVEFYCHYDEVDYYGDPDEEVDKWGRSLRTYILHRPGMTDRLYAYTRVRPGNYKAVLLCGGKKLIRNVLILKDYWYDD